MYKKRFRRAVIEMLGSKSIVSLLNPVLSKINGGYRKKNIIMFHSGRCGSTVIGSMLNQDDHIYWPGEIFNRFSSGYAPMEWAMYDPISLVKLKMYQTRSSYFGFEIKDIHLKMLNSKAGVSAESLVGELMDIGFEYAIILERKNYIKQMVSAIMGSKMGFWNTTSHVNEIPNVYINVENTLHNMSLVECLENKDAFYRNVRYALKGANYNILNLSYEEHVLSNPAMAYKEICNYLDKNLCSIEVVHRKINSRNLSESINNYDEVYDLLRGGKYEWMLA
jgi:hypothetical protein